MNRYALWKYILILFILLVGALYALPNIFGQDPAVQISSTSDSPDLDSMRSRIEALIDENNLKPKAIETRQNGLLVRFSDETQQLKARDLFRKQLGEDYIVALNLAPSTPQWLRAMGGNPMYLGLDLRGGVHFLMQVDMEAAVDQAYERFKNDFRDLLRDKRIRYAGIRKIGKPARGVEIKFKDRSLLEKAAKVINSEYPRLDLQDSENGGAYILKATMRPPEITETKRAALKQNLITLRNRVNELGVAEPIIQQQGIDRIIVQLPGVQDTARAKEILGATATLEFRLVDEDHSAQEAEAGKVPAGSKLYHESNGRPVLLKRRVIITGDRIVDAASGLEQQTGSPAVFITLDGKGSNQMYRVTKDNINKPMAVVFIESKVETKKVNGEIVKTRKKTEKVINVATIRAALSKNFQITGLESPQKARTLALLLRAGSLSTPIEIVEERTVGPSLGQDNINQGFESVVIGFIAVLIFMIFRYKVFGLISCIALFVNLILIVAALSMLQATLTLPGIAGIVLTVGMAVDANVLIFERIREELQIGSTPQISIQAGYQKALSTIADANITTLIAAVVLYGFGTGPIKGFAITLALGIISSMFTAIMGTRAIINLIYGGRKVEKLLV
ncbi:MAG: protein translocase subunit SecD [Gammaproteobacteria bacterium]|nr:MAG: protein translocase subunit SecD [Gammaproteobacteria bacterium]